MASGGWGSGFSAPKRRHDDDEAAQPAKRQRPAPGATNAPAVAPAAPAPGGISLISHALAGSLAPLEAALDADPSLLDTPQAGGMYDSRTLLQCAASKGHEGVVAALLARGANVAAVDKRGATAAALATSQKHAGVAALLAGGVAPAPAPAPAAAEEGAGYTDSELLDGSDETAKAPGGAEDQESDIYGILTEGAEADLL